MSDNPAINFAGNIEANALFTAQMTDVVVCDGFAGNIVIKQAEAFHSIYKREVLRISFLINSILKILEALRLLVLMPML